MQKNEFKLNLDEKEKDAFMRVMVYSDDYKAIIKTLEQLTELKRRGILNIYQDGSEKSKNDLVRLATEHQGAEELIKSLKELRAKFSATKT